MKISKLRKKLQDKKWVAKELDLWIKRSSQLENFYRFKCSDFFAGEHRAEMNREIYYDRKPIIDRHIRFLKKMSGQSTYMNLSREYGSIMNELGFSLRSLFK